MEPKYPNIHVQLSDKDGNALAILGRIRDTMRKAGVPPTEWDAFFKEATSGDYNHLLRTCMQWVDVS